MCLSLSSSLLLKGVQEVTIFLLGLEGDQKGVDREDPHKLHQCGDRKHLLLTVDLRNIDHTSGYPYIAM